VGASDILGRVGEATTRAAVEMREDCQPGLRRLNSSIAIPQRSDLDELWIKSGFRCVV